MIRRGALGAVALALLGVAAAGCGSTSPRAAHVGNPAPAVTASTTPAPTAAAGGAVSTPTAVSPQTVTTPILAGTTPPVASSSTVAPSVVPSCSAYGGVVASFDSGEPNSYIAMKPNGSGQCSVGIPGYELAGFSHDLSTVAVADEGTLGSGHPDTYVSVSPLKGLHLTRIWTMGDDLTRIPTWSPSGKSLAFGLVPTEENGASAANPVAKGLWTIGSNGRNRRLLVPGYVGPVVWSANGTTLAFITTGHQGQSELATVPSGGGKVSVIATLEGINDYINDSIAWSPSGKFIVLAYRIQNAHAGPFQPQPSGIDRYPAAGGKPQAVVAEQTTRSFTGVAYSPDGTRLMISGSGLLASASGTTTVSTVPGRSATTPVNGAAPQGNNYFLETMNADGSDAKLVATFSSSAQLVGWFSG